MGGGVSVDETTRPQTPWSRRKKLVVGLAVAAMIVGGTLIWFRMTYPYGVHHICSKIIGLGFRQYAGSHGGWLPYGESSPESSLSLLCVEDTNVLANVGGKHVPPAVVRSAWEETGRLGPESCGWHYVEGLRQDDDPMIAAAWDKVVGIDHFGQRRRGFAREVVYLDGSAAGISMKNWPQFALEQREKLALLIVSRPTNAPPIRWSDEETLGTNRFPLGE